MNLIAKLFTKKLHDQIEKEVYGDSLSHAINVEAANMANLERTSNIANRNTDEFTKMLIMLSESDTKS